LIFDAADAADAGQQQVAGGRRHGPFRRL